MTNPNQQKLNDTSKGKLRNVLSFFVVGALLFALVQSLLTPVWNYPNSEDNLSYSYDGFFSSEKNIYDVLFIGTSHVLYGISPMEIYKNNQLVTYNLGTSGQPMDATLATLEEAFESQNPKVVVLDASSLFIDEEHELDSMWRFVMDSMPFGMAKIKYAHTYAMFFAENEDGFDLNDYTQRFASVFLPIIEYHDRYDELNSNDIWDNPGLKEYYMAGYFLQSFHESSGVTLDEMNENPVKNEAYAKVYVHNVEVLKEIKRLCEEHNAQLLLTKIPSIHTVKWYTGAWTLQRYQAAKKVAMECDITYFDLLYDGQMEIDVEQDFTDGGAHLNYLGAKKVSKYLGDYLFSHYELNKKTCESFDNHMEGYDALTQLATLQLTFDRDDYESKLQQFETFELKETQKGFVVEDSATGQMVDKVTIQKDGTLKHKDGLFLLEDYWLAYAKEKQK